MRFATLKTPTGPHAAVQVGDHFIDLFATDSTLPNSVKNLLVADQQTLLRIREACESSSAVKVPVSEATFLPPVPDPAKILCVGLNYRDHAIEGGKAIPTEPVLFGKFSNTLIAHGDTIRLPKISNKVDYEAELVIVVGKSGRNISEADALNHVAGYTVGHDVSARDWQFRGEEKQWIIGKTFDTFAPTGPVVVTADEVGDPHKLQIQLRLNGVTMQNSNTKEFIFTVPQMIAFLSQVVTLEPGDLIFTGTPPGVGAARKPPVFLKDGDVTEVEIEKLGILRNPVAAD